MHALDAARENRPLNSKFFRRQFCEKKVVLKDPSQKRPRGPFIYNFFLDHSLPSKTFKLKVEALPASTNQPTYSSDQSL